MPHHVADQSGRVQAPGVLQAVVVGHDWDELAA